MTPKEIRKKISRKFISVTDLANAIGMNHTVLYGAINRETRKTGIGKAELAIAHAIGIPVHKVFPDKMKLEADLTESIDNLLKTA